LAELIIFNKSILFLIIELSVGSSALASSEKVDLSTAIENLNSKNNVPEKIKHLTGLKTVRHFICKKNVV